MTILVTGAAGFIGAHVCRALSARGDRVVGLDSFNDYYDPRLKRDRLAALCPGVEVITADLADATRVAEAFGRVRPGRVVHLAAQAGVRRSGASPEAYVRSNLVGFGNVLEACRQLDVAHLVYASSSSVYGASGSPPFSEDQRTDAPLSFYAATKASNELMARAYAETFGLRSTALRFFTVYGTWGRPDMVPVLFPREILAGRPITLFNEGRMRRDFTHVDDIVAGVAAAVDRAPEGGHAVFNLGNESPVELLHFLSIIEAAAGRRAEIRFEAGSSAEVSVTAADASRARQLLGFDPRTRVEDGLPEVVAWCREYYRGT
jgi:UDP-glucuronate 4-epimerase